MTLISGPQVAETVLAECQRDIAALKARGVTPGLAVVLVGDDPASRAYVRSKDKKCRDLGLHSVKLELPATTTQQELLDVVAKLNTDPAIHGILVQSPQPKHIDNSAEEKNQTLNMELSQKQRDQVDKQQRDLFDLSMSGQRSTISLLGTAKGFAALLQAFGIDTREFMDMCDQGMKEAKSKVEGMDYKALEKPSRTIDTTGGERRVSAAEAKIPADLAEAMDIYDQERAKLMGAAGSGNPKQTATAEQKISENKFAPKANETSYSTAEVIAAIGKDGLAGVKADPAKMKSTIEKKAALDGNAASLSSSELIELNKKMLVITGSQAATDKIMSGIKSHPNRPDDGPGTTPGPQAKANIAAPSLEYNK